MFRERVGKEEGKREKKKKKEGKFRTFSPVAGQRLRNPTLTLPMQLSISPKHEKRNYRYRQFALLILPGHSLHLSSLPAFKQFKQRYGARGGFRSGPRTLFRFASFSSGSVNAAAPIDCPAMESGWVFPGRTAEAESCAGMKKFEKAGGSCWCVHILTQESRLC